MEKQQIISQILTLVEGVNDPAQLRQLLSLVQTLVGTSNGNPSGNGSSEAMHTDTMSREEFFKKLRGY